MSPNYRMAGLDFRELRLFTSASRSLVRMIAGWLPWEIDRSHFSPQSQSTWSPHLPPTSSLPPPSQSAALTQSLAGSLADFTQQRTFLWQKDWKSTRPARRFAGNWRAEPPAASSALLLPSWVGRTTQLDTQMEPVVYI